MKTWITAGVLVVALACAGFVVSATADSNQEKPHAQQAPAKDVKARVADGHKLCSVISPGHWRDTINVPDDAIQASCTAFMREIAGSEAQLGCIFPHGIVAFGSGKDVPSPNCGWEK